MSLGPGVPESPCRPVNDGGALPHLAPAAPLLRHWSGRGRVVGDPGEPCRAPLGGVESNCLGGGSSPSALRWAQLFRRALVRMFQSQDLDCVFMELHINPRQRRHMVLECVPLPRELGDMAPIYFKVRRRPAASSALRDAETAKLQHSRLSVSSARKPSWSAMKSGP